ncbi:class I tRNA ligase family protein [Xanthomonas translucens]|uniref:class I tRNA ligase family protein n=1 Tax=Xanthomonas campestris pv. translucens TaxID=343 RepID=UPI0021CE7C77|nr:class I tRNA ligase family protein [Xanthomonas translucens]
MRGDLPSASPIRWPAGDEGLYAQLRDNAQGRPLFVLHDGRRTPTARSTSATRQQDPQGHHRQVQVPGRLRCAVHPGWDCHGLPIEIAIEKKYGKVGVKLDAAQFRQKCANTPTSRSTSSARFQALGVIGDWDNPYRTLDFHFEANEMRALARIIDNGHLTRGVKPVHWCFDCGSALAEAEIEYADKQSPTVDVAYTARDARRWRPRSVCSCRTVSKSRCRSGPPRRGRCRPRWRCRWGRS